jgi:hypothetical protein
MTDVQQNTVAPGWYADPAGSSQLRWWNGTTWTEHLADAPQSAPEPNPPVQSVPTSPAVAPVGEHQAAAAPEQAQYVPFARNWAQEQIDAENTASRRRTQTLPAWLLAVSPLWFGVAAALGRTITSSWDPIVSGLAGLVVGWGLMYGLAYLDGRRLEARGHSNPTSPAWVLLFSPIFFIIRTVRVGVGGLAPLLTNVAVGTVLVAAAIVALSADTTGFAGTNAAPTPAATIASGELTPAQRAADLTPKGLPVTLRTDLTQSGHTVTKVSCAPFPNTKANTTTTCRVTMDGQPATTMRLRVSPEQPRSAFTLLADATS